MLLLLNEKRYSILEVIKILGVCRKTLYLWEKSGRIPKAKRDPMSKYRYWNEKDLMELRKITQR